MTFVVTWNETSPADGDQAVQVDDFIRDVKIGVRERLAIDHKVYADETGHSDVGYHDKVTLPVKASDPDAVTDACVIFTKDASGKAEVFVVDEDGNVVQMTSGGQPAGGIPSGSRVWFHADTAPTGFTLYATATDVLLAVKGGTRAYNTTGGTLAGTWDISANLGVGNTTLTTAQIPSHRHEGGVDQKTAQSGALETVSRGRHYDDGSTTLYTSYAGGGESHTHSLTTPTVWRPRAAVGIICTKD